MGRLTAAILPPGLVRLKLARLSPPIDVRASCACGYRLLLRGRALLGYRSIGHQLLRIVVG